MCQKKKNHVSLRPTPVFHSLVAVNWGRGGCSRENTGSGFFLLYSVGEGHRQAPRSQERFPGDVRWTAPFKSQPVSTQSRTHAGPWVGKELSTLVTSKQQTGSPIRCTFTIIMRSCTPLQKSGRTAHPAGFLGTSPGPPPASPGDSFPLAAAFCSVTAWTRPP